MALFFVTTALSKVFSAIVSAIGVIPILDDGADGGCNAPGDATNGAWVNIKKGSPDDGTPINLVDAQMLPASSAFTTTAYYTLPAGTRRVTFIIQYAKHASATTGQAKKRVLWKFGTVATDVCEPFLDTGNLTVSEPKVAVKGYCEDISGPQFNAGTTTGKHQWTFEVPAGATGVIMQLAEIGDATNRGTVSLWIATSPVL